MKSVNRYNRLLNKKNVISRVLMLPPSFPLRFLNSLGFQNSFKQKMIVHKTGSNTRVRNKIYEINFLQIEDCIVSYHALFTSKIFFWSFMARKTNQQSFLTDTQRFCGYTFKELTDLKSWLKLEEVTKIRIGAEKIKNNGTRCRNLFNEFCVIKRFYYV